MNKGFEDRLSEYRKKGVKRVKIAITDIAITISYPTDYLKALSKKFIISEME